MYRSAAAETRGRWLAWLVQAEFRGLRRFSSALREAVAPETVRRTRRRPHALTRLPVPVTDSPAADQVRCGGKAGNGRAPGPTRVPQPAAAAQRPPGTSDAAAAVSASRATPPPVKARLIGVSDESGLPRATDPRRHGNRAAGRRDPPDVDVRDLHTAVQRRRNTRDGGAGGPVPTAAELAEGAAGRGPVSPECPAAVNVAGPVGDRPADREAACDGADPGRARGHRLRGAPWREHGQRAHVQAGKGRAHLRACAQPGQDLPAIAAGADAKARPLSSTVTRSEAEHQRRLPTGSGVGR